MCNKMSDVRLSNASPTVERVDARQPDNVRPPVRRNLFGTPDPEEIRRCLQASVQGDVEAFEERYNYDPVNERPLSPRNYVWQEDRDAPEFYRRQPHRRQRPRAEVDSPESRLEGEEEEVQGGERRAAPPPDRSASRKRHSADSGRCSSEHWSKRLHTDDDDDDDEGPSKGAGSQALTVAAAAEDEEEKKRPSRPEDCAEVQ
ncbi:cyclin-dependent kinase inhibitor 1Ba [Parambassis ranga]|uniref:Cyclin-dependent kinase inhibitor 1B n=1 Tax=Parambassis ranga TaxID=210632 RepID=A0A6P7HGT9_9TELE|nr:cyclin-dependent kinase inhibitor 1B-like [Parambassis ranga]